MRKLGILLLGIGSGGTNILSRGFAEHPSIRSEENCCYCINSSSRDFARVEERFRWSGLEKPKNFQIKIVGTGFGAGKDVRVGVDLYRKASDDIRGEVKELNETHEFLIGFSVGCLGGGFGTLVVAEACRNIQDWLGIPIIPLVTLPRRGEGELMINNAKLGLIHLSELDLFPILYDNERASQFSSSVGVAIRRANRIMADTIAGLVNTVQFRGFAIPPIDITDITKVVKGDCASFVSYRTDDVRVLQKMWRYFLNRSLSLDSKPLNRTSVFCSMQGPEFPGDVADDIAKYLRSKFHAGEVITPILEAEEFEEYSITAVIYGMSKEKIKPKLKPLRPIRERILGV